VGLKLGLSHYGITYTVWGFENRVLRRTCGSKRQEVTWGGGNCIMRSFIFCRPAPEIMEDVIGGACDFFLKG
jgi:hypothetical protein